MNKIGIWNTAFLGDAILTLPLIRTIKHAYPEAELHYWVRGGLESLFAAQPDITRVHPFSKRGVQKGLASAYSLGRALSGQGYGLWISAHTSLRSAAIAHWSSIKTRIGYTSPWYNRWCYTHTVDRRFSQLDEIERLLQLARPLHVPQLFDWPEMVLPADAQERVAAFWQAEALGGQPVLGIHPGSVWPTKCWPALHYAALAATAAAQGATVIVFAGPGEEDLARTVMATARDAMVSSLSSGRIIDLAGALSLPDLAAHIGRLSCYLTNDSGPMHMAWTQRVPTVALFGPTVRRLGFFPRGAHSQALEVDLACRPCGLHGHKSCPEGTHACMQAMTPDIVWPHVALHLGLLRVQSPGAGL